MDPAFTRAYQASTQSEPRVFGLSLKTFTLGHLFLLESIQCHLISGDEDGLTFADIGAAVFVCAHADAEESKRNFSKWWFPLFTRIWARFAKPEWFTHDLRVLRTYLEESLSSPGIRPASSGGKQCEAPGTWIKLFFAQHVLHLSRAQAMLTPVVEINSLYAVWAEWNGTGELVNSEQMSALWKFAEEQDRLKYGGRN